MSQIALHSTTGNVETIPSSTLTSIAGGRSHRRPAITKRNANAMHGTNIGISHMYASARHADFLAEAARERTIASASSRGGSRSADAIRAIRQTVGAALIRFGERLHGAEEACADLGSFRAARA